MKLLSLLFIVFSFSAFTQSIERQLYVRYFKPLYPFEPAVVREQEMEELSVWSKEVWKEKSQESRSTYAQFRADGRPIFYAHRERQGGDSLVSSFTYDSLGQLIEYKQWSAHRLTSRSQHNIAHYSFLYTENQLQKVLFYAAEDNYAKEQFVYCDSLVYSLDRKQVYIYRNKTAPTTFFQAAAADEKEIDNEQVWQTLCQYKDSNLRTIQQFFHVACLSDVFQASVKEQHFLYESKMEFESKLVYDLDTFRKRYSGFYLDTVNKQLQTKSHISRIQPTSMEDLHTHTLTIAVYNDNFQLTSTTAIQESRRGEREYHRDSIQTTFEYTAFGWNLFRKEDHFLTYERPGAVNKMNQTIAPEEIPLPVYSVEERLTWKKRR